jgi:tRNA (guanine37-N1)-methyltransferase|uniref:tRNA (guanine-N(1)-)-methyltransferase n=1 Tax=candidate division WOR-3 bacterium TaxID=2052148 RepID=A0A7V3RGA6_UNCW3
MHFYIISLFPEYFKGSLSCGTLRIAQEKGLIKCTIINPRDFVDDQIVDDYQFGGGAGMVLKLEPILKAINSIKSPHQFIINFSPTGKLLNQNLVKNLVKKTEIILICGRYKGIDERLSQLLPIEEISIGDYVTSGGECAALVLMEAITRLIPGVLGHIDSAEEDSLQNGLLSAPVYTRPANFKNHNVPEILISGNHQAIAQWRRKKSLELTLRKRPELLPEVIFTKKDLELLLEVLNDKTS